MNSFLLFFLFIFFCLKFVDLTLISLYVDIMNNSLVNLTLWHEYYYTRVGKGMLYFYQCSQALRIILQTHSSKPDSLRLYFFLSSQFGYICVSKLLRERSDLFMYPEWIVYHQWNKCWENLDRIAHSHSHTLKYFI